MKKPRIKIFNLFLFLLYNFLLLCAGLFIYVKWAEFTEHDVIEQLRKRKIIQSIFLRNEFVELERIVLNDDKNNSFETIMDFDWGIAISKDMFIKQEMFGQPKYIYRPNIGIYNVIVWSGLEKVALDLPETPQIKRAIAKNTILQNVFFKTDSFGFKKTDFTWNHDSRTIFFLGDSFTEGLWVAPKSTFVNQVGLRLLKDRINLIPINLGVNGYSALEMDWMLEHYAPELHPEIAIANLFPNDVHEDYLQVIKGINIAESNYSEMFYYLKRMKDFCKRYGIMFVVAVIPAKEQFKELRGVSIFHNRVKTWCETQKLLYLDPISYFDSTGVDNIYLSWDAHFSPQGHFVYAKFIYKNLYPLIKSEKKPDSLQLTGH